MGASIGGVAGALVLVPAAVLLHAWSRVFPGGADSPPTLDPADWAASLAIANVAAGAVAGAIAASVRLFVRTRNSQSSAEAWLVCLGGGLTWALVATVLAEGRVSPSRLVAAAILGFALGALVQVALFPTIVAAIAAAGPAFHRRVWAAASRIAAFSAGLLGALLAGPLTLGAATVIVGIAIRGWPSDPSVARYVGPLFVGWIITVVVTVLGLRAAGVPRHWQRESKPSTPADAR